MQPFLISATVIGIIARRLVRRICPYCRIERELTADDNTYLQLGNKSHVVWEGQGCKECRGTGYKERTGIFEVLDISERIKSLVTGSVELADLAAADREEGLATLRQVAISKMLEGATTYEEVMSMNG